MNAKSNKKKERNSTLNFLLTRYSLRFPGSFYWHYWFDIDYKMMSAYVFFGIALEGKERLSHNWLPKRVSNCRMQNVIRRLITPNETRDLCEDLRLLNLGLSVVRRVRRV